MHRTSRALKRRTAQRSAQDEVAATRKHIDWPYEPFQIPQEIAQGWDAHKRGGEVESKWQSKFAAYRAAFPELAADFERRMAGELPSALAPSRRKVSGADGSKHDGTRDSSNITGGVECIRA